MDSVHIAQHDNYGFQELSDDEIAYVSGAGISGREALAAAGAIGTATFGTGWAGMAVGAAFAASPLAVVAMGGLVAYGVYKIMAH